jgi:hypothetical protein
VQLIHSSMCLACVFIIVVSVLEAQSYAAFYEKHCQIFESYAITVATPS